MSFLKKSTNYLDTRFMKLALALARRGLGNVSPNPAVGCVLVSPTGVLISRGWTQTGGRPHAETEALVRAGNKAAGATVYVTLEPCSHVGETTSCAVALIKAGITRVVSAMVDPDPRVSGRGHDLLMSAGIEVTEGVCATESRVLNAGFIMHREQGRPLVTLKTATTLDGCIATNIGESKWITGTLSRNRAHMIRMSHDGIIVGIGTVLADNPELSCRLPGLKTRSPVRIIIDKRLKLPLKSKLVSTSREIPTWVIVSEEVGHEHRDKYQALGVSVIPVALEDGRNFVPISILRALAKRGLTRVLVEGGSRIAASFLEAGLVDRLEWFRASSIIGGDGLSAIAPYGVEMLSNACQFVMISAQVLGDDRLETYCAAR